jgi:hypothetical protein
MMMRELQKIEVVDEASGAAGTAACGVQRKEARRLKQWEKSRKMSGTTDPAKDPAVKPAVVTKARW